MGIMRLRPHIFSVFSGRLVFRTASGRRTTMRAGLECGALRSVLKNARLHRAFTLVEMLVVLIIIVLLAALALPHIRGSTESVAIKAATQQVAHDLAFARQKAISQRSTVAMVFLSTNAPNLPLAGLDAQEQVAAKRLQGGIYTHYAIYAFRR